MCCQGERDHAVNRKQQTIHHPAQKVLRQSVINVLPSSDLHLRCNPWISVSLSNMTALFKL